MPPIPTYLDFKRLLFPGSSQINEVYYTFISVEQLSSGAPLSSIYSIISDHYPRNQVNDVPMHVWLEFTHKNKAKDLVTPSLLLA